MTKSNSYITATGRVLTDDDIDAIARQVEHADYDTEVVPVRLDPELKSAVEARAEGEQLFTSEIIRRALRRYLDVA